MSQGGFVFPVVHLVSQGERELERIAHGMWKYDVVFFYCFLLNQGLVTSGAHEKPAEAGFCPGGGHGASSS